MRLAALGVVYGDIGTSPLYAFRESFREVHHLAPVRDNILGIASLVIWSLVLIISVKYVLFVTRAHYHGEGGVLALATLVRRVVPSGHPAFRWMTLVGLCGTALLYGDGMITPAISVLSAVEGLEIAAPDLAPCVVPLTFLILVVLFSLQSFGSQGIGATFGPVIAAWLAVIAALGVAQVAREPGILAAVNPLHGVGFFMQNGWHAFLVLGSVFLAVTGGEALYADLGHFGYPSICSTWFVVVLPSLLLNYLGQGALLLRVPEAATHPFFSMAPTWAIWPLVLLATAATVIASQAVISGAFSITMQAVQLGYLPRVQVLHTSPHEFGQIYVPVVSRILMVACVGLVLGFKNSGSLAAAYGVAVTLTMVITTVLFYFVLRHGWGWRRWRARLLCGVILFVELAFFSANALKIPHGGWYPLGVGAVIYLLMSTWKTGREAMARTICRRYIPLGTLVTWLTSVHAQRVPGTAIFLYSNSQVTPPALRRNVEHNHVLHDRTLLLTVETLDRPYVPAVERVTFAALEPGIGQIILRFGYLDRPDVPKTIDGLEIDGERLRPGEISFFLSRETVIAREGLFSGMPHWREKVYAYLNRNARDATSFFNLPPGRVIEVGIQVEI